MFSIKVSKNRFINDIYQTKNKNPGHPTRGSYFYYKHLEGCLR